MQSLTSSLVAAALFQAVNAGLYGESTSNHTCALGMYSHTRRQVKHIFLTGGSV